MKPVKLTPFDYQSEALANFEQWWYDAGSLEALIALTMGMGKTVSACLCVTRLLEMLPQAKILWLTHREELIDQSKAELELYTRQYCEVEKAECRSTGLAQIIVGSVATLRGKRLAKLAEYFTPDLIICDEAHHALAVTWMQVKQTFSKAKVLNLTATPYRADIANRLDLGKVLVEKNTSDGIRMGVLVPPKPVGKLEIDLGSVKKRLGDYDVSSLSELLCHKDILTACVTLIKEHAPGHKSLLFAASVEHGRIISEMLRGAGFRVGEVYGETPTDQRQKYYKAIQNGDLDVITNNLCVDSKTEILTLSGWKTHETISKEDLVANWEEGRVWFEKPKNIILRKRAPKERMIALSSRQKSIRVTEGHRMLVRRNDGSYVHKASEDLIGRNWQFPVSGVAEPAEFLLPQVPHTKQPAARRKASHVHLLVNRYGFQRDEAYAEADRRISEFEDKRRFKDTANLTLDECRFIGFWLGDKASDHLQGGGIEHKLYQGESWPNVVDWVDRLCNRLGYDFLHKVRPAKDGCEAIHIWSFPRGTGWRDQARKGVFCLEPYLLKGPNPLLWNLNERQFDALIEGYWFADGNHKQLTAKPKWIEIRGTREKLFDQVQAIAVCRRYKASLRPGSIEEGLRTYRGRTTKVQQDWILTLAKKQFVTVASAKHQMQWDNEVDDEVVWCVSTTSTNIITRRDGYVTIMGNCLTEGFNLPALDLVIVLRPTRNAGLYLQMVGRGLRKDRNNPKKTHCKVIDIIDTAKRKGGKEFPLPTDDDRRVYSALQGRQASLPEIFLSWYYRVDDVSKVIDNQITIDKCTKLGTPGQLFQLVMPPWIQAITDRPTLEQTLGRVWTEGGEYNDLLQPLRANSPATFKLLLSRKGWLYFPHGKLPNTEEELDEVSEGIGVAEEEEENYTITTLISNDAELRNFILDLFDPNQSLKEQSAKCYDLFALGPFNRQIAWFRVIHQVETKYHFIQWKDTAQQINRILIRTADGKLYCFEQKEYRKLEHVPAFALNYGMLPDFVKGTSWAKQPMSEKQATHVCKILDISTMEAASMRISKLSASALMSNQWNRAHLKNIGKILRHESNLQPCTYEELADLGLTPVEALSTQELAKP